MNQATRAALFSLLLVPGGGQIYLKRYARGLAFLVPALAATVTLAWMIFQVILAMIRKAASEGAGPGGVLRGMEDGLRAIDLNLALGLLILILFLWISSTIDAYRLGSKTEPPTTSANRSPSSGPV
jgi:TM2 domain-containing membrane protein YozV